LTDTYRDKVDPAHKMAMDAIGMAAFLLAPNRPAIERFLEAERQSHTIGLILDPTLYRDQIQSKNFALQVRIAKAALAFLREIDAVGGELIK